jgi:hypothetical protein
MPAEVEVEPSRRKMGSGRTRTDGNSRARRSPKSQWVTGLLAVEQAGGGE